MTLSISEKHRGSAEETPNGSSHDTSAAASVVDNDGYGSTDDHIFKDPVVAQMWAGVYEKANYENRHRFDPNLRWSAAEEKKLLRKIDLRIMTWAWVMFCALDIHRRNINRAISDNMLAEIGKHLYGQRGIFEPNSPWKA